MNNDVRIVFEKLESQLEDAPTEATQALKSARFGGYGYSIQYSLLKNQTKMVSIIIPEHTVTVQFSMENEFLWANRPTEWERAFEVIREKMEESAAPVVMNNEEFYDKEIAPVLAELARKCQARNMAFVAAVDNREEEGAGTYNTLLPADNMSAAMHLNYMSLRSLGNMDTLLFSALKHSERFGHNSVYLSILQRSSSDK